MRQNANPNIDVLNDCVDDGTQYSPLVPRSVYQRFKNLAQYHKFKNQVKNNDNIYIY